MRTIAAVIVHRVTALAAAGLLLGIAAGAHSQQYPSRPIRLVSPNPAGGANDVIGRIVASRLGEILNQQVVVDNRGGAGGMIAAEIVARAVPDGYTLIAAAANSHSIAPNVFKKVAYDPVGDFAPISMFALVQNTLSAGPGFAPNSVKELVALAKAKPAAVRYASAGIGSASHVSGLAFAKVAGIEFVHVPYKGGAAVVTAMLSGEASFNFGPAPATAALIKTGRLKALAVSGAKRSRALPDVPTVMESGIPYTMVGWFGIMAPRDTPPAIVKRLHTAVDAAIASEETSLALIKVGADPQSMTPQAMGAWVADEFARYRAIIREAGISAE